MLGGVTQPPQRALATGANFPVQGRWPRRSRRSPRALRLPQFPVIIKLMLTCEFPRAQSFTARGGLLEMTDGPEGESLTLTTAGWHRSRPWLVLPQLTPKPCARSTRSSGTSKTMPGCPKSGTEAGGLPTSRRAMSEIGNAYAEFLRCGAQPQAGDRGHRTFGNNTAIACHMANASYFQQSIAVWDGAARRIQT